MTEMYNQNDEQRPAAGAANTPDDVPAVDPARVSRLSTPASTPPVTDDEIVREYTRRYRPADAEPRQADSFTFPDEPIYTDQRNDTPRRAAFAFDMDRLRSEGARMWGDMKQKGMPRSYSTMAITEEEKLWSAVAHGSVWLTVIGGFFTAGTLIPLSIFVPLVIYFIFRKRSDFVAFHALQSFALQAACTVGALALLTVGGLVWSVGMVVALLAMLVLVGFILVPLWGLVGLVGMLAIALMPVGMALLGTIAAIETYNGRDYRFPRISNWIDRQMAGGVFQA